MLEIILCLTVATLLVIGWARCNLFACVFLTLAILPVWAFALYAEASAIGLGCFAALVVVWLPVFRKHGTPMPANLYEYCPPPRHIFMRRPTDTESPPAGGVPPRLAALPPPRRSSPQAT